MVRPKRPAPPSPAPDTTAAECAAPRATPRASLPFPARSAQSAIATRTPPQDARPRSPASRTVAVGCVPRSETHRHALYVRPQAATAPPGTAPTSARSGRQACRSADAAAPPAPPPTRTRQGLPSAQTAQSAARRRACQPWCGKRRDPSAIRRHNAWPDSSKTISPHTVIARRRSRRGNPPTTESDALIPRALTIDSSVSLRGGRGRRSNPLFSCPVVRTSVPLHCHTKRRYQNDGLLRRCAPRNDSLSQPSGRLASMGLPRRPRASSQ
jgi:hypothetical protein